MNSIVSPPGLRGLLAIVGKIAKGEAGPIFQKGWPEPKGRLAQFFKTNRQTDTIFSSAVQGICLLIL